MKTIVTTLLLLPLMVVSQNLEGVQNQKTTLNADNFINAFYQNHDTIDKMILFFDESYFETYKKFVPHMELKNKKYGAFVSKKLLKVNDSFDNNTIWRQYKVQYLKGFIVEEIKLKRNSSTNEYKIIYWQTTQ